MQRVAPADKAALQITLDGLMKLCTMHKGGLASYRKR